MTHHKTQKCNVDGYNCWTTGRKKGGKRARREHYTDFTLSLANCESQYSEEIFLPAGSGEKTCLCSTETLTGRQTVRLFLFRLCAVI